MHAVPVPEFIRDVATKTVVIGPSDPTDERLCAVEYVVQESLIFPGRPVFSAVVELDDDDRAKIAAGARIVLTLDGAEVPWSLHVLDDPDPPPDDLHDAVRAVVQLGDRPADALRRMRERWPGCYPLVSTLDVADVFRDFLG